MGPVKCILCKIHHFIKDLIGNLLRYSTADTSGNLKLLISIYEVCPFLFHNLRLFLGHGTPHHIAPPQGITGKLHNDLHNLFLIHNTAIGIL